MLSTLSTILLILFLPVCILLILIVLLQAGKGGGLAGAFGGGGGQTFLGARGAADFLSKLTIYLAISFMLFALILSLTYGTGRGGGSINIEEPAPVESAAVESVTPSTDDASTEQGASAVESAATSTDNASTEQSAAAGETTSSEPASTEAGSETTPPKTDQ